MLLRGLAGTFALWAVGFVALRATIIAPEVCPTIDPESAMASARAAAEWIQRTQRPDGSYLYEYDIVEDREIDDYNRVRHAGVTMSLYQLAVEGDASYLDAADRAVAWMQERTVRYQDFAAMEDADGTIALGGNALLVVSLAHRRIATGDPSYDDYMREVSRYLLVMQDENGGFLRRWYPDRGAPDPVERSIYATGEAFWALALMHRLFPGEGWDVPARRVADYLALYRDEYEEIDFPPWADQWAAYSFAEMAGWPGEQLADHHIAYIRSLAKRFGFLVRFESRRTGGWLSDTLRGPQARAAGLGTWVEALSSLSRLAEADPRLAGLAPALDERLACSAGMLRDRQVSAAEAQRYASPANAEGAWFDEGRTRMDDQQHALSGLALAIPSLSARQQAAE
jgi:hypothetical protein